MRVDIGIEQWYINSKGFVSSGFAFADMLAEYVRIHRARTNDTESASIADGRGETPSAAPYHSSLYDGILDPEELSDSVLHVCIDLLVLLTPEVYLCIITDI